MPRARVVFLGRLQDVAGCGEVEVNLAGSAWSDFTAALSQWLNPAIAGAAEDPRITVALNGAVVAKREALVVGEGDEVALLPPVSGG